MGELLYFKNCEERKKAEELLKKYWPEASFVVMRLDMQNTIEEERVHFGKWDIEFKKKRMIYDGTEIIITDLQWDILELLMSDSELSFSIKEIAYATNIEVYEAQIYVEELLKTIKEHFPNKTVWCYSGFTFEELVGECEDILKYIDVLVDGAFVAEKKNLKLKFRGSENQRIINVKKSLEDKTVTELTEGEYDEY